MEKVENFKMWKWVDFKGIPKMLMTIWWKCRVEEMRKMWKLQLI